MMNKTMRLLLLCALCSTPSVFFAQNNKPPVPYSKAIVENGFLFIAGHLGTKDGQLVTESFEAEVRQAMLNIEVILKENGLTFDDAVAVTIYLKDMNNYDRLNEAYRVFFTKRFPTRTCIGVAALPRNGNVEITVTAAMKK